MQSESTVELLVARGGAEATPVGNLSQTRETGITPRPHAQLFPHTSQTSWQRAGKTRHIILSKKEKKCIFAN